MSRGVAFAPRAERDLEDIGDYIARRDPERARSFVRELRERCEALSGHPRAYRLRPEFGPAIRSLPHGAYLVLYRERGGKVAIERILHAARDLPRPLGR